jgi:hypothetical protein
VQKIKEERFKEEMGVFKILYERPFLQEYKNVMYARLYGTGSAVVFSLCVLPGADRAISASGKRRSSRRRASAPRRRRPRRK